MHFPLTDDKGAYIPQFICPCCNTSNNMVDPFGNHIFNCKRTNKQQSHNEIRDAINDACKTTIARSHGIRSQIEVSLSNMTSQYGFFANESRMQLPTECIEPRMDLIVRYGQAQNRSIGCDIRITFPNKTRDAFDPYFSAVNAATEKTMLWCNPQGRLKADVGDTFFPVVLALPFGAMPGVTKAYFKSLCNAACPSIATTNSEGSRCTVDLNNRRLFFKRNLFTNITLALIRTTTKKIDSFLKDQAVSRSIINSRISSANDNFSSELNRLMNSLANYPRVNDHLASHINCPLTRCSSVEIVSSRGINQSSRAVSYLEPTIAAQNRPPDRQDHAQLSSQLSNNRFSQPSLASSVSLENTQINSTQFSSSTVITSAPSQNLSGQVNRKSRMNQSTESVINSDEIARLDIIRKKLEQPCDLDQLNHLTDSLSAILGDPPHCCWGPDRDTRCPAHFGLYRRRAFLLGISNVDLVQLGYIHSANPRCSCATVIHTVRRASSIRHLSNSCTSSSTNMNPEVFSSTQIMESSRSNSVTRVNTACSINRQV
jgi:hypothetical protein